MQMHIQDHKSDIRRRISLLKKQYSAVWRSEHSQIVLDRIESLDYFKDSHTILLYHALWDEVQTASFIEKWHPFKRIILPIVEEDHLLLRRFHPDKMKTGAFSILEPADGPDIAPEEIELAIIPGVAFDRQGNRLGRGKGFYDRLLPFVNAPKVGIAFSYQLINEIPTDPYDKPVDWVITDTEVIDISRDPA